MYIHWCTGTTAAGCERTDLCFRRKQHHTSMQCWTRRDPPTPPGAPSGLSMARQAVQHVLCGDVVVVQLA
jgi:hypothetical protein